MFDGGCKEIPGTVNWEGTFTTLPFNQFPFKTATQLSHLLPPMFKPVQFKPPIAIFSLFRPRR